MDCYFTNEDFILYYNKILKNYLLYSNAHERPTAFMILGQPGSGKSFFSSHLCTMLGSDFCYIDGDYFRKIHPKASFLEQTYGEQSVLKKAPFANAMVEKMILELSLRKRNLVIQGTLRSLEIFFYTVDILKICGYQIVVFIMATKPMISYKSTISRYGKMVYQGIYPRKIYEKSHNQIVYNMSEKIESIYQYHNLFENILVYNRFCECLFSDRYKIKNPASIFSKEIFGYWKSEENRELDRIKYEINYYVEYGFIHY